MTAEELLAAAEECVTCGRQHTPWRVTPTQITWAGKEDGHPYRTRIFQMTGHHDTDVFDALRQLAGLTQGT